MMLGLEQIEGKTRSLLQRSDCFIGLSLQTSFEVDVLDFVTVILLDGKEIFGLPFLGFGSKRSFLEIQ
jgi:hypothetical protein